MSFKIILERDSKISRAVYKYNIYYTIQIDIISSKFNTIILFIYAAYILFNNNNNSTLDVVSMALKQIVMLLLYCNTKKNV